MRATGPDVPYILMARALSLQNLNRPTEAIDSMDRSLALRRDDRGLLMRARIALLQGQMPDAKKYVDEAISKSATPDALLFKAGIALTEGQFQAALDISNQALEKFPGNLQARFARVESYLGLRQDDKAKAEIDDILAKTPNVPMGLYYRALLLARSGNNKAAWDLAQNLSGEFRDSQPRVALRVSEMALAAGNADTSASILGRLLLKEPASIPGRVTLASIRLQQSNADEALKVLEPIKDVADIRVQEMLSNVYVRLNRPADALGVLRKLNVGGKGAAPQIQRSLALLEIQTGDINQGIKDLSLLAGKNPGDALLTEALVQALVQAKRYPEALAAADWLAADPSQRVRGLILRGGILTAQNNMTGAQVALDKAVAADPKSVAALSARANYLLLSQKTAAGEQDLRAVLALDPKNLGALLKLADVAAQQGRDQNVRSLLGQAIAAAPQSAVPRQSLIRYLSERRDFKSALPVATDFARLQPSNGDAVTMLGAVQFAAGQKKEAVATYRRLTALLPAAAGPQVLLGDALWDTGDHVAALSAMDAAAKRAPNDANVRAAQIRVLLSAGNNDGAVAAARAFQSANPGTAGDVLLSETLDKAKQHDQSVAVLNQSLADHPSNVVLLKLASLAMQGGDGKRGADMMSNWLVKNPNDLAVRMEYAGFLMGQGDGAQAIPQYEAALKQNANNAIALNNLGWLIQTKDPKRALALLNQARKLSPGSPDIADTLGWFKVQQKDAAGGLELLNKAHSQKPKDGSITYHLAVALDANGKRDAARGLLKSLLASNVQFKERQAAVQLSAGWH